MTTLSSRNPRVAASAAAICKGLGISAVPATLVVLGSGFKGFEQRLTGAKSLALSQVPHMPAPSVEGHGSALVCGTLGPDPVAVLTGRVHLYEGYGADAVVYPLRTLAALGVKRVLLTNASGSLRPTLPPGQVVLVRDQINLTGTSCLGSAEGRSFGPLFVDMSSAFDTAWGSRIKSVSAGLHEGVYAGVLGPAYETPAEARMLGHLGADIVGMSTVQEVLAARQLGLSVVCLSFVTNWSGGLGVALKHDDVLALVAEHAVALQTLLCHAIGVQS